MVCARLAPDRIASSLTGVETPVNDEAIRSGASRAHTMVFRRSSNRDSLGSASGATLGSRGRLVRFLAQSALRLERALEQTRFLHPLGPRRARSSRAAPAQLVHILEQRFVGSERCEILEQKREVALGAQYRWRKAFDGAVPVQEPCRRD